MKKLLALLLALLLLVGGSAFAEETGLTKDIVVLFTSDVHCGIDQGSATPVWPPCGIPWKKAAMYCWWTMATLSRGNPSAP